MFSHFFTSYLIVCYNRPSLELLNMDRHRQPSRYTTNKAVLSLQHGSSRSKVQQIRSKNTSTHARWVLWASNPTTVHICHYLCQLLSQSAKCTLTGLKRRDTCASYLSNGSPFYLNVRATWMQMNYLAFPSLDSSSSVPHSFGNLLIFHSSFATLVDETFHDARSHPTRSFSLGSRRSCRSCHYNQTLCSWWNCIMCTF